MKLIVNQTVQLINARQRQIGQVTIQSQEVHLIFGTFTPGPDYEAVEDDEEGEEDYDDGSGENE